jgi:hypothetical protein
MMAVVEHARLDAVPLPSINGTGFAFDLVIKEQGHASHGDQELWNHGKLPKRRGEWGSARQSLGERQSSAALDISGVSKSARGLAHYKTWRHFRRLIVMSSMSSPQPIRPGAL